eukprot:gene33631-41494_t
MTTSNKSRGRLMDESTGTTPLFKPLSSLNMGIDLITTILEETGAVVQKLPA